ncbi:hypothetical protein CAPTEDRAFT_115737, partial [Capitella teleta]
SCYKFSHKSARFSKAEAYCNKEGGNLVSIHNKAEFDFVKTLIKNNRGRPEVLIGLNDRQSEGKWVWTDGTTTDFLDWSKHDPNNVPGDGDIVRIKKYPDEKDSKFADGDSRKNYPFVCKKIYGKKAEPILRE